MLCILPHNIGVLCLTMQSRCRLMSVTCVPCVPYCAVTQACSWQPCQLGIHHLPSPPHVQPLPLSSPASPPPKGGDRHLLVPAKNASLSHCMELHN